MFDNESFYIVEQLVDNEYQSAKKQHGDVYSSQPEAYDVLDGEIGEASDELMGLLDSFNTPKHIDEILFREIEMRAKLCILECAQVVAVCRKGIDSIEGWKTYGNKKTKIIKRSES